jgi:hypothetical protein
VPFPRGRHVRPPNHKPMPSRAGDTAARGECRNPATHMTVPRLRRSAPQNGPPHGERRPEFASGNERTRGGRLGASGIALAQFTKRIVTIAFQGQGEGYRLGAPRAHHHVEAREAHHQQWQRRGFGCWHGRIGDSESATAVVGVEINCPRREDRTTRWAVNSCAPVVFRLPDTVANPPPEPAVKN